MYVSMLLKDFVGELKDKTGINAEKWSVDTADEGRYADRTKLFVVMLDDAQSRYCDADLWGGLVKADFERRLPTTDNVRFVIAATHSLSSNGCPVDFSTLPKLVRTDFMLSKEEVHEFIRLSSVRMGAERAGSLLLDPVVSNMIATNCNGHIGALSVSVREIGKAFLTTPLSLWRRWCVSICPSACPDACPHAGMSGELCHGGTALRAPRRESAVVWSTDQVWCAGGG